MYCRIFLLLIAAVLYSSGLNAQASPLTKTPPTKEDQAALEGIIVEKYYVATDEDCKDTTGGVLAKGSVTYRIYADLKPGYHLQAVFGLPDHEFFLKTTTSFFNNSAGGGQSGGQVSDYRLNQNTVALDSWLTIGVATQQRYGVLKSEDTGDTSLIKRKGLDKADGLMLAGQVQRLLYYGIDISFFNQGKSGSVFKSDNGSWAVVGGGKGPTKENRVLVAQLTTNGKLSFELNLQVGCPSGATLQYVAKNPKDGQIKFRQLTYK
jgi:hypothetical protein